ncbi:hypothetical protein Goari_014835 [Gossypium aridum]|uniref:DUF7745 domain-containing protein n=1 Tax=Gossypium aridum TaxID=34290 RepID=A0A7J8XIZ9_GOSAI|nr:hypothetical protein [Gossypium aridum]
MKKSVDVFALSIYGLVVFPKAVGHMDEAVFDLFDRLDKRVIPISAILVETFKSLNTCRRAGDGRFIGLIPSELEIIKQDFKKNLELGKKMEQLEEEKMQLGLDVDVQKLEADKLKKGKNKAEEDLNSLKIDYKKLR